MRCLDDISTHGPPRNTSTQAQFTPGPPPGSANKRFVVAGAARAVDGASLLHGPLRVDRTAETEKKVNGWTDCGWTQRQGTDFADNGSATTTLSASGSIWGGRGGCVAFSVHILVIFGSTCLQIILNVLFVNKFITYLKE